MSETIQLTSLSVILPNQTFASEKNCTSLQLSYNLTGGSFSISLLKGTAALPSEDQVITLPFGRYGVVKGVGNSFSTGGLLDTITGPAQPLAATEIGFAAIVPLSTPTSGSQYYKSLSQLANELMSVGWNTFNPFLRSFTFRGVILQGIQQLAQNVLGDVIAYKNGIYVVGAGQPVPGAITYSIPNSDIVSAKQDVDYSLDFESVLNPAISAAQLTPQGNFMYDQQHAQIQGQTTVSCGAHGGTGSSDFQEIPPGWLVEGEFEEWQPQSSTDLTNPAPTVPGGRYWKQFPSPSNPGYMRGIISFTRIVKDLKLPGNVSTFVASPITGQMPDTLIGGATGLFVFEDAGVQSGLPGFNASAITDGYVVNDIISGQLVPVQSAMSLIPLGGNGSGIPNQNFWSITIGLWTFPRVNPQIFPTGNPANPYNLPPNVLVINPSANVVIFPPSVAGLEAYWAFYVSQYQAINSPRLKTTVTCVFRNAMPQPGDILVVPALANPNCGRISSVTLNYSRGGITLNISAEVYNFGGNVGDQTNTSQSLVSLGG